MIFLSLQEAAAFPESFPGGAWERDWAQLKILQPLFNKRSLPYLLIKTGNSVRSCAESAYTKNGLKLSFSSDSGDRLIVLQDALSAIAKFRF